ncbi:MAG TPA: peptidoglycan-associated lipoprotein Pal [Candidatus Manganitrophaceae bacterium]|nr:peptidoglycan-associated lipoprotein Pal [Candidatus Manganitrophaceae bacterium]
MERGFTYIAGILILFSSLVLTGCPKKVAPVEGSAGISKEKPAEPPREAPRPETAPIQEEKLPPLAREEPSEEETRIAPKEEAPASLEDVFFEFDQWLIRPEARKILEQDARYLAANPQVKVQIEGYCDERGTTEYNLALGERRAKSAMNFLVNLGVSPSRISTISYGEEKPFCEEKNEACFQKNRRAHFVRK